MHRITGSFKKADKGKHRENKPENYIAIVLTGFGVAIVIAGLIIALVIYSAH